MWLVGVRDLQFRRRRFMIAALATSVVFAMTLIMSGMSNGLDAEIDRLVDSFHADSWAVACGRPARSSPPSSSSTTMWKRCKTPGVQAAPDDRCPSDDRDAP
jgi:putative ABC transport system permease protein